MNVLWLDFETYSECDIKERGGMNYAMHPSTQMICAGMAFDDEEPQIITPANEVVFPDNFSDLKVYAHNATFDFRIWNYICVYEFGWPALSLDQMVDTMALCQMFQLPASLDQAGAALGISMPKDARGKQLIKMCCVPQKNGQQPTPWGANARFFSLLYEYCKRDVEAMRQIVNSLPRKELIPKEHKIWAMTYDMNTEGLPVDYENISIIHNTIETYVAEALKVIPKLSDGMFSTLGQIAKIRDWCDINGYPMKSLTAADVSNAIADDDCPEKVKQMMRIRQELGRSSTAKYKKLKAMACKHLTGYKVHDNLVYHGAGTGRWAGRSFQVHNLPRASVESPEEYISCFKYGFGEDTTWVAKGLIRPMICAADDEELLVSDYSSIENRGLHWLADDTETLEGFRNKLDQYKDMAAARYKVNYVDVTKPQRQMGKVIILGCGFGMGADTFQETAYVQFGMTISIEDSQLAVRAYREKYEKVVALWANLKTAMATTVITGQRTTVGRITFGVSRYKGTLWLAMLLPSGKSIYYCKPEVHSMHIPKYEHMGRVPTVTHMGINPYSKKWERLKLIPGRITENAVQGTAREVMAQGLLNVKERMPMVTLLASVHDEAIAKVKKKHMYSGIYEDFNKNLCDIPWADGLPLAADGWIGKRYRK